jgi:alpha-D-xyloside xylohydrolase
MSSRGYGLFLNTSNPLHYRVGELEHTALSVTIEGTELVDAFLIYGPSLNQILSRYTDITGKPAVPPKWSFGLWMGRISYNTQDQVEQVAADLRAHQIPCDVIHIDTGWYDEDWQCDLEFGSHNFPDPARMLQRLHEAGFRTSLWQWPNMVLTSEMFAEGRDGGFLVKRENGEPYIYTGFGPDAGLIDYSNPEAVAWVGEKFRRLFAMGVAAIKTDFGEGAPINAVYHDGDAMAMHNRYPLLYNAAVFNMTTAAHGPGQGIVWSRSAWAGSQRYPVHWSGDGIARFEDLACVLRAALSFGMSGFPFYSHDIGGFSGIPSPELYVRWAQLAFFGSHVRCHGMPPREPWGYGEEAERIFRRYDNLRYRLLPYIYSEAVKCGQSSLPMMRPLFLSFPDDLQTWTIEDQFMFGDNILVAPVLDAGSARRVYLPAGRWVDYWRKEQLEGGRWHLVDAPLERIPLFVRVGAIIPMGPLQQYVDEKPLDPLQVEIWGPVAAGEYTVFDDCYEPITIRYRETENGLDVEVENAPGEVEIAVHAPAFGG